MKQFLFIVILTFIGNNLSGQTFSDFQLTNNEIDYTILPNQTFKIDSENTPNILYLSNQENKQMLWYSIINDKMLSNKIAVDSFKVESNTSHFVQDYSIHTGINDTIYIFYYVESTTHDNEYNILNQSYKVVLRKLSNGLVSDEIELYQTNFPMIDIDFKLDAENKYHGVVLLDGNMDDPESSKKMYYLTNSSTFQTQELIIDNEIKDINTSTLAFELDSFAIPHIVFSTFNGFNNVTYLNYYFFESNTFIKSELDSILPDKELWFRSAEFVKNADKRLFLIYLKDSVYVSSLKNNKLNSPSGLFYYDNELSNTIYSVSIKDSLLNGIFYNYEGTSKFFVKNIIDRDAQPIISSIQDYPISIKVDHNGFINGIFRETIKNSELFFLKSKIALNPLPLLPPQKPYFLDSSLEICLSDSIFINYQGIEHKWYLNDTSNQIGSGNSIYLTNLEQGINKVLLTETILDFESKADTFIIKYNEPNDTSRYTDTLFIDDKTNSLRYVWNQTNNKDYILSINNEFSNLSFFNLDQCLLLDTLNVDFPNYINNNKINSRFNIYPNPSSDYLYWSPNDIKEAVQIQVYNSLGELIFMTSESQNGIDISTLTNGLYFIRIHSDDVNEIHSFIKY